MVHERTKTHVKQKKKTNSSKTQKKKSNEDRDRSKNSLYSRTIKREVKKEKRQFLFGETLSQILLKNFLKFWRIGNPSEARCSPLFTNQAGECLSDNDAGFMLNSFFHRYLRKRLSLLFSSLSPTSCQCPSFHLQAATFPKYLVIFYDTVLPVKMVYR